MKLNLWSKMGGIEENLHATTAIRLQTLWSESKVGQSCLEASTRLQASVANINDRQLSRFQTDALIQLFHLEL